MFLVAVGSSYLSSWHRLQCCHSMSCQAVVSGGSMIIRWSQCSINSNLQWWLRHACHGYYTTYMLCVYIYIYIWGKGEEKEKWGVWLGRTFILLQSSLGLLWEGRFHRVGIVLITDCSSGTSGVVCSHFDSRGTAHELFELVLPSMAPSR